MGSRARDAGGIGRRAWRVWVAAALVFGLAGPAKAADIETRDFVVLVSGKPAGEVHMTIHRQDNGQVRVRCDTDIKVSLLVGKYTYLYRGLEVWKDGRVVRFDSNTDDNGKRYVVAAVAEPRGLRVKVNNAERVVPADVWLSSYWCLPDPRLRDQQIPILDADTGRDLEGRLQFVATEKRTVATQNVNVNHYRLTGKVALDLWYDGSGRLVRQEWIDHGHRAVMELTRVRR
jgi:hypothetical protein